MQETKQNVKTEIKKVPRQVYLKSSKIFRYISNLVERLMYSRFNVVVVIIITLIIYLSTYFSDFTTVNSSSKTVDNVGFNVIYNQELFEIEGLPKSCSVTLVGSNTNVINASNKKGSCVINLDSYAEGTYNVKVATNGYGDNVNTIISPNQVTISLKRKNTMSFNVAYDLINENLMDSKYIVESVNIVDSESSAIYVRASNDALDSISIVRALIDVAGKTSDFETDAQIVCYNKYGEKIDAEISPSTVKYHVTLASPSKSVPIKINTTGNLPDGFAVDSIALDKDAVTLYAPQSVLDQINDVSINVDLSLLNEKGGNLELPIIYADGVKTSDVKTVNATINVGIKESTTINDIEITFRNNDKQLIVEGGTNSISVAQVTVYGTASNIAKVLKENLTVYIDMLDVQAGYVELPLNLEKNVVVDFVNYELNTPTISMVLKEN